MPACLTGRISRFRPGLFMALCLLSGCEHAPATYGSHQRLPAAPDRVLVVGNQPSAVSTALTWLQARGLSAVGTPMPWDMPGTEKTIADQAHKLNAQAIVWVQLTGDLRAPMVSVRGIDVNTQAVLWSGHARDTDYRSAPVPNRVALLTCHALNAAWGERATDDRRPGFAGDRCE